MRLDADVEFYANPALLLDELGEASVLLTPHRTAPEFHDLGDRNDEWGGVFNVQCEVFRGDESGLAALRWWHQALHRVVSTTGSSRAGTATRSTWRSSRLASPAFA